MPGAIGTAFSLCALRRDKSMAHTLQPLFLSAEISYAC
jgi:hypothetical protein